LQQISEERKKQVIDLYFNQHKPYAEIAKIMKMSPRDIHAIIKEEEIRRQRHKDQQQQEEISSKTYELFSEGKKPVEVAIALNLREPEATKLFMEYCKLNRLTILNSIYKETNGRLGPFLKLFKELIRQRGMSIDNVVNAVDIAIHKLPYMESLYGQVKEQVDKMQYKIQGSNKDLNTLNDEIASAKVLLNSYHMLCERKRQEAGYLNNEITRLETVVSQFKNNDEEYLKITKGAEEEVRNILTDGKVLLQFALASIIEAMRRNPDKYNNLLVSNASPSSILGQDSLPSHIYGYRDIILDEANRLYDRLLNYFTNSIMDNAVGVSSSNYSPSSAFPKL
jgi:predicted HTH domain antitoxin